MQSVALLFKRSSPQLSAGECPSIFYTNLVAFRCVMTRSKQFKYSWLLQPAYFVTVRRMKKSRINVSLMGLLTEIHAENNEETGKEKTADWAPKNSRLIPLPSIGNTHSLILTYM